MNKYELELKELSNIQLKVCQTCGEIFQLIYNCGYDIRFFAHSFMTSSFCKRYFDTEYSWLQLHDAEECFDWFDQSLINALKPNKSEDMDKMSAYYLGYMYRFLFYYLNSRVSSKDIYEKVPYSSICNWSSLLSREDPNYIANRILEESDIDVE